MAEEGAPQALHRCGSRLAQHLRQCLPLTRRISASAGDAHLEMRPAVRDPRQLCCGLCMLLREVAAQHINTLEACYC